MAVIAIFPYMEEGHIFPCLSLASTLQEAGHEVIVLTLRDLVPHVEANGFHYEVIFIDIYPEGSIKNSRVPSGEWPPVTLRRHIIPLIDGTLDEVFARIKPELLVIDGTLALEALIIHYRYSIKQLFFCTVLREEINSPRNNCLDYLIRFPATISNPVIEYILTQHPELKGLADIVRPIDQVTELILCPKELDLANTNFNKHVHHIGPCVREVSKDLGSPLKPSGRKLILLTFGSQSHNYISEYRILIEMALSVMRLKAFSDFQLIIALGPIISEKDFPEVPSNTVMKAWINQREIIARCEVVITHGGLGCIKECIYNGIPMIVFAMTRDQPRNALCVENSKVGKKMEVQSLTPERFADAILDVSTNLEIKAAVAKMKQIFINKQAERQECWIINELLSANNVSM